MPSVDETRMIKIAAIRRLRTESSVADVKSHSAVLLLDEDGLPLTACTDGVRVARRTAATGDQQRQHDGSMVSGGSALHYTTP